MLDVLEAADAVDEVRDGIGTRVGMVGADLLAAGAAPIWLGDT